jgi:hypothetical protein
VATSKAAANRAVSAASEGKAAYPSLASGSGVSLRLPADR